MNRSIIQGKILSDFKSDTSLVFVDFSIYNKQIAIQEPTLTIFTPYSTMPVSVPYITIGNTILTTLNFKDTEISQIPCGLYKIKQSICPHDKLFNEFWYVHTSVSQKEIAEAYCNGDIKTAKELDLKIKTLEALSYCKDNNSEKRILSILKTLNCDTKKCNIQLPMKGITNIQLRCNCNKPTCNTCNQVSTIYSHYHTHTHV